MRSLVTDGERIEAFKRRYEKEVAGFPNVQGLEFLGSCLESWRWRAGKSDLDIIVYGNGIQPSTKIECVLLIQRLNSELGLCLENVSVMHPTPFFIDSPLRRAARQAIPHMQEFTEPLRGFIKRFGTPLTYAGLWAAVHEMQRIESLPFAPKLSGFL